MDTAEQIKAKLPIEDIIRELVNLVSAGKNRLKGLCPFHSERTPSFHIMPDKGFYYCHSCKAHGSVIDFTMRTRNLEFREALELLAPRAGVELSKPSATKGRRQDLYDLNELAQTYFTAQLAEHPEIMAYLTERGLTLETIQTWGFGYVPEGWTNLTQYARTKGASLEALELVGLARSKDGRYYDMFRARITIPIRDTFGRTVGFSARTLSTDPKEAKYVNTPETDVFKKGELLFGLDKARSVIRKASAAILVEGQLDVIALHQAGFTAAVGAQSATLTEAQINLLERLEVTHLYAAFDADLAGQQATLRSCDAVVQRFIVKIVKLPHKDPAETVKEDPELFRIALKRAVSEPRYRVADACAGVDLNTLQGHNRVLERLKPAMLGRSLTDPVAAELREWVIRELGISSSRLNTWLDDAKTPIPASPKIVAATTNTTVQALRCNIAALVLTHEEYLEASCKRLQDVLADHDPLAEFAQRCADAGYNATKIVQHLSEWEHVAGALAHIAHGLEDVPLMRLERDLARYAKLVRAPQKPKSVPQPPEPTSFALEVEAAIIQTPKPGPKAKTPTVTPEPIPISSQCSLDEANDVRLTALFELLEVLPDDKREPVYKRYERRLIDRNGRGVSDATLNDLLRNATALRLCARSWAAGRPSNPANHLPPVLEVRQQAI